MPSRNIEAQSSRIVERSVESSPGEQRARDTGHGARGKGGGRVECSDAASFSAVFNKHKINYTSFIKLPAASACEPVQVCVCEQVSVGVRVCVVDWQVAVRSPLPCNWGRWSARAVNGA